MWYIQRNKRSQGKYDIRGKQKGESSGRGISIYMFLFGDHKTAFNHKNGNVSDFRKSNIERKENQNQLEPEDIPEDVPADAAEKESGLSDLEVYKDILNGSIVLEKNGAKIKLTDAEFQTIMKQAM